MNVPAMVAEAIGTRVHLVPGERDGHDGVCGWIALCGSKPGFSSAGWSARPGMVANCPRCLARDARQSRLTTPAR